MAYAVALAAAACAPAGNPAGVNANPDVITRAEFEQAGMQNATALQLVERLRPRWLRPHAVYGLSRFRVVADDVHVGGLEALRGITSGSIASIRLLTASEALGVPALGTLPTDAAIVITRVGEEDR